MKLKLIIRLAVILSLVLLCTAFGVYSFFRLSAEEHRQDFDLFTLVPDDVSAVVETDQLDELVRSIDGMKCSQDGVFLYASDLFVLLKDELHALQDEAPHGLSIQMNKMLLSFHRPDDPTNQVLYFAMGRGDYDLMESFIEKSTSAAFPSKYIDYHGEEIRIYPMVDGRFLSVCLTHNFLVASFQKRLIEQVIDTYHSRHSLAHTKSFKSLPIEAKMQAKARLYVRMTGVSMGADSLRKQTDVGDWTVYDLKLEEEAIYCSGVCRDADTANQSFIHLLKQQQPTEVSSGDMYPSTTLLYHNYSLTDKPMTWDFLARYAMVSDTLSALRWKNFVQEYGGEHVQFCLFTDSDSLAHAVAILPLVDKIKANQLLCSLYPPKRGEKVLTLPDGVLFSGLVGLPHQGPLYLDYYNDCLLISNRKESLISYQGFIQRQEVIEGDEKYERLQSSLSSTCRFLLVADMAKMLQQPEPFIRLIPHYFIKNARFFGAFTVAMQLTCADDLAFPNLVLFY